MVKVKTIIETGFVDLKDNKFRIFGDEFETTPERAEELSKKKFVEIEKEKIEITKPQEPKKSKKKIDTDI